MTTTRRWISLTICATGTRTDCGSTGVLSRVVGRLRFGVLAVLAVLAGCGSSRSALPPPSTSSQRAVPTAVAGARAGRAQQPAGVLPDPVLTPGVVASTDAATVCAPGYSRRVRPPAAYTSRLKRRQLAAGYPGTARLRPDQVEEDHLVMLALGGDPTSERNLWPEPRQVRAADGHEAGAAVKDRLEGYLYDQVCHHGLALQRAQAALAGDWYVAYLAAGRPTGAQPTPD